MGRFSASRNFPSAAWKSFESAIEAPHMKQSKFGLTRLQAALAEQGLIKKRTDVCSTSHEASAQTDYEFVAGQDVPRAAVVAGTNGKGSTSAFLS
jgi:hypothetical protein